MNFRYCLEQDKDLSCFLGTATSGVTEQTPVCETLPGDGWSKTLNLLAASVIS